MKTIEKLTRSGLFVILLGLTSLQSFKAEAVTFTRDKKVNRVMNKFSEPYKYEGIVIIVYKDVLDDITWDKDLGYKAGVGMALAHFSAEPEDLVGVIFMDEKDDIKIVVAKNSDILRLMNNEISADYFANTLTLLNTSKQELNEKYAISL